MNTKWDRHGNSFFITDAKLTEDKLDSGIYTINTHPIKGLYLVKKEEAFEFPYKFYGKDYQFADRVKKSFDNTIGNLGVLLNGLKGTGKTITAELICNKLNLPVVIVDVDWQELLIPFMNNIEQDVIYFFDEFEKVFPSSWEHSSKLLPIMDGVLRNRHRKVFLLTTNESKIEASMLSRPGRIRYLKTYGNLSLETITEIVDDKLVHKKHREALIKKIASLEIITMDIVKAVVDETNIFNESPEEFFPFFNVTIAQPRVEVFKLVNNNGDWEEKSFKWNAKITPTVINEEAIQQNFYVNNRYLGDIVELKEGGSFVVKVVETDDEGNDKEVFNTYRVEASPYSHYNTAILV